MTEEEIDTMGLPALMALIRHELETAEFVAAGYLRDGRVVESAEIYTAFTIDWSTFGQEMVDDPNHRVLLQRGGKVYLATVDWKRLTTTVWTPFNGPSSDFESVEWWLHFPKKDYQWWPSWTRLFMHVIVNAKRSTNPPDILRDARTFAKCIIVPGFDICSRCNGASSRIDNNGKCGHTCCSACERAIVLGKKRLTCPICIDYYADIYRTQSESAKRIKLSDAPHFSVERHFNGDAANGARGNGTCPVCLETFTDAYIAYCGHTLCRDCWVVAANRSDAAECPTCRVSCSLFNMRRNFAA